MIIFYSTHCPRCEILEKKLKEKNISYNERNDIDEMVGLGLTNAPAIRLENGQILDYGQALRWLRNEY